MSQISLKFTSLLAIIVGLICSQSAMAARWATIVSDGAIIYSDIQMTSKIGFISKGKKVRVGEKARNHGKLLPLIINKRIAYIEIKNLQTSTRLEYLKSATQRLKKQTVEVSRDDRISIYGASMFSSVKFSESATAESQIAVLFLGFGIKGYKSSGKERTGLRGGIEYLSGTNGDHKISYWSIPGDYYYKFMKTSFADIYLFGGGTVIPYAEYKLGGLFTLNGYGFGAQAGAEMILKYNKYAIHFEGAYQYTQFMGFEIGGDNPKYPDTLEPTSHGVKLLASLSFNY